MSATHQPHDEKANGGYAETAFPAGICRQGHELAQCALCGFGKGCVEDAFEDGGQANRGEEVGPVHKDAPEKRYKKPAAGERGGLGLGNEEPWLMLRTLSMISLRSIICRERLALTADDGRKK